VHPKDVAYVKNKMFVNPNFEQDAEMFDWAGVNFGEEESYKICKAIKRLAQMSGGDNMRFFGKIYGTKRDYWIICGKLKEAEETVTAKHIEKRGQGVNAQVFWVTDNLLNDWIQLPECRPEHIMVARMIKHVFTGDLNAEINSNPPFPGKERHLLRATLARISFATQIVPKGLFEIDEETNEMKFTEDFQVPPFEELKSLESWGNLHPIILQAGRVTHSEPEGMEEDAKEAYMADLEEKDKTEERFRAIQEHKPMPGLETAWLVKIVGDQQQYNLLPPREGTTTYSVMVLRSLRWPGAITVTKGGKCAFCYLGYGLKRGDPSYNPTEPPEVQKDPQDQYENPEPTPLEAPQEPPEPDTDAEKKGSDEEEDD